MDPGPAAAQAQVVVIPSSSSGSLSSSSPAPGAGDSSDITSSPARRPFVGEAGWLHSLSRESWSQRFSVAAAFSSPGDDSPPAPASAAGSVDSDAQAQGPLFTFVLALLACSAGVMVGILAELKDTIGRWRTVPRVLYGVAALLAIAALAVGFMAAGWQAAALVVAGTTGTGNGNSGNLTLSDFCAKLSAILSTVLLVVAFCCKLGRWGCATGVPCSAAIAVVMAVLWICGDERAAARAIPGRWRRFKDRLCSRCLSRRAPASTADSAELSAAGGREGDDGIV